MTAETTKQAISYDEAWRLASTATWRFESYCKYKFTFTAHAECRDLTAVVGDGTSQDVYRFEVTAEPMTWDQVTRGECELRILGEHAEVLWEGWPL